MLDVLDVRRSEGPSDVFTGPNLPQWRPRLFGGQVLGQVAVAAGRTVEPERALHSLHAYFLRPGDPAVTVEFAVERLRDGRSFSSRRVQALQNGVPILSGIASFQVPADGLDHAGSAPDVPGPEELRSDADVLAEVDHPGARRIASSRPIEIRHVDPPVYLVADPSRAATQAVWLRVPGPLPADPLLHRAALAYASDFTVLEPVLRRHGLPWSTPGASVASLDHAMWWHREARADEWVLFVGDTPSASGARALATARMFDRQGRLVATVAQEGMVRVPGDLLG
nr:acyl-CoA thioesterase II [Kineococcus siccus]